MISFKFQLFERICMALGGRVAESLTFNRVTSGMIQTIHHLCVLDNCSRVDVGESHSYIICATTVNVVDLSYMISSSYFYLDFLFANVQ